MADQTPSMPPEPHRLRELGALFLKLGTIAFGGPAAHIAMMREEVVERRKWVSEQDFLDLLGVTNLIPGPNSTEMAINIGLRRGGRRGLVVAGTCFILPAFVLVTVLAWAYVQYGSTPAVGWLLYGVKPVIIVIVAKAIWDLGKKAVKNGFLAAMGVAAFALYLLGLNVVLILLGGGVLVMAVENLRRRRHTGSPSSSSGSSALPRRSLAPGILAIVAMASIVAGIVLFETGSVPQNLTTLFLTFFKIGAVLYGSGYVLLAFVRSDFVVRLGWLTNQQVLDAVAVGQVTPGPVFTTATFIGYLVGGLPGAAVATAGIFVPAFVFVAVVNPWVPRLRASPWASGLLDGVNVIAVALMAAVAIVLGLDAVVDIPAAAAALVAGLLLFRYRTNPTWLVLGGAAFGIAVHLMGA